MSDEKRALNSALEKVAMLVDKTMFCYATIQTYQSANYDDPSRVIVFHHLLPPSELCLPDAFLRAWGTEEVDAFSDDRNPINTQIRAVIDEPIALVRLLLNGHKKKTFSYCVTQDGTLRCADTSFRKDMDENLDTKHFRLCGIGDELAKLSGGITIATKRRTH